MSVVLTIWDRLHGVVQNTIALILTIGVVLIGYKKKIKYKDASVE